MISDCKLLLEVSEFDALLTENIHVTHRSFLRKLNANCG